jgi:hypothetical protein
VSTARRDLWLLGWTALGPVLWFVTLLLLYAFATRECSGWVPLWSWSTFGVAVLGHAASLVAIKRAPSDPTGPRPEQHDARVRFMHTCGLVLTVFSLVLMSGFSLPLLMMGPCE